MNNIHNKVGRSGRPRVVPIRQVPARILLGAPTPGAIRDARISAGMTQIQAAEKFGITCRTWIKYERGDTHMHSGMWEQFKKICNTL